MLLNLEYKFSERHSFLNATKKSKRKSHKTKEKNPPIRLGLIPPNFVGDYTVADHISVLMYKVHNKEMNLPSLIKILSSSHNKTQIAKHEEAIIGVLFEYIHRHYAKLINIFLQVFNNSEISKDNYLYKTERDPEFRVLDCIIGTIADICEKDEKETAKEFCRIAIEYDSEDELFKDQILRNRVLRGFFANDIFKYEYMVAATVELFVRYKGTEKTEAFLLKVIKENHTWCTDSVRKYLCEKCFDSCLKFLEELEEKQRGVVAPDQVIFDVSLKERKDEITPPNSEGTSPDSDESSLLSALEISSSDNDSADERRGSFLSGLFRRKNSEKESTPLVPQHPDSAAANLEKTKKIKKLV